MNTPESDLLEDALSSYPSAELPAGFRNRALARIRQTPQMARFHLTWLDYALGFLLVSLPPTAWLIWKVLPPEFFLRLQFNWMLLEVSNGLIFLGLGLAFLLTVFLALLWRLLLPGSLSR